MLDRGAYRDVLTGASWAAVFVGFSFVAIGLVIGEPTIAELSFLLVPFGVIGLADHYADKAESSPVVRPGHDAGTVVLRYRPLRALVVLAGVTPLGGIAVVFGWREGLEEAGMYGICLCAVIVVVAVSMAGIRRSARLTLSPTSLGMRLPGKEWEFAWDSITEIGITETSTGDAITIACDSTSVRRDRKAGFLGSRRRRAGEPNEPRLIPVDPWGVGSVELCEALTCLWEHPALRAELTPALLTELLVLGFESPALDERG